MDTYRLTVNIKNSDGVLKYYDVSRGVSLDEYGNINKEIFVGEPDGVIEREWSVGACTDFIDYFEDTFIVLADVSPRLFVRQGDYEFFCSNDENKQAFDLYMNVLLRSICR